MKLLAHLLLPRVSNNQRAKLLHLTTLNLITLFLLVYQLTLSAVPRVSPNVLGYAANISPDEVIRLTNEKRASQGLNPLTLNPQLSRAAVAKGNHMLKLDYWAHVAPDGTEPWKFFRDVGYRYKYAGENLARDFTNPPSTIEAWMASPSHRANMMSPKYREIGVGVVEGDMNGVDTTIVVQLFGTRVVEVAAVNTTPASPSTKPSPIVAATITPQPVLTVAEPQRVLISPFNVTRTVSLTIIGVLVVLLILDGFVITRRKIARVGGRPWAHISFMALILVIILIAKAGAIL